MDHSDRCDRCGAQAFVRAVYEASDLMFCAHHAREYRQRLSATAIFLEDESEKINVAASPAAY